MLNEKLREEKDYYHKENVERLHFGDFVGGSEPFKEVLASIGNIAGRDTNVLIPGETGVGKEMVARAIHQNSDRKDKAFIRVNCSVFTETLIASELFGHEKGAFTGADSKKSGRFELADQGTIFLDEIGDIPMEVQVRLLRVLQTKEFERVGGRETVRSDFRLILATK